MEENKKIENMNFADLEELTNNYLDSIAEFDPKISKKLQRITRYIFRRLHESANIEAGMSYRINGQQEEIKRLNDIILNMPKQFTINIDQREEKSTNAGKVDKPRG